ncbi:hypothetical protein [Bradyrhizobium sp. BR 1433]|uniref:hypothetical protein n=1 Tax=Bradyrhizobium sp. BR 1433 TaxID=3447967 RepID=UPI003EE549BA
MAAELIRLEATDSKALAIVALLNGSTFTPFQISIMVDGALAEANRHETRPDKTSWSLVELVTFGLDRHAEADRLAHRYIVVSQLYEGSSRISSRIEEYACVVGILREAAVRGRAAFAVLSHSRDGWVVSEYANCTGDRVAVNAALPAIRARLAAGGGAK